MLSQRTLESSVGVFLLASFMALLVLALKVSGLTSFFQQENYEITAQFDDIGGLKVRSPVKIGGVLIGEVSAINLDPKDYRATVTMRINRQFNTIPDDSTASILTSGLLGDNYVALTPQYSQTFLKNGSDIQDTRPAIVLEKLIGQLMFKIGGSGDKDKSAQTTSKSDKPANSSTKGATP